MVLESSANLILTAKFVTSVLKMPGYKRRRSVYGARPMGRGARGRTMSVRLRRYGAPSLGAALSRVHVFKRVGNPLLITNLDNTVTPANSVRGDNTSMVNNISYAAGTLLNTGQLKIALKFALTNAAQRSEITDLFDNYRISRIKLTFNFSMTGAPSDANSGGAFTPVGLSAMPMLHGCYDPDDAGVVATRESVLASGYARTRRLDKPFSVTIVPRAQNVISGAGGAAVSGGLLPITQWLDSSSPDVPHYGFKFVLDDWPIAPAALAAPYACLTITPTFYIEGKNVV